MLHAFVRGLSAAAVAALLTSPAVPATGPARAASPPAPASPVTVAGGPAQATPVLLITGERLLVGPGPQHLTAVQRPGGALFTYSRSQAPSQTLKIPVMALPYLGRGLDPGLFRLGALQRAERGGRLPVRLSHHGALPAVPGVTITRSGRGVADGYLTAASARIFGAALRRQFAADHARGSYGSGGLFAGGLSIALAGAAAPRRARANFPMVTLTVTGSDLAGRPDTGDLVLVFNLDNPTKLDPVSSVNYFYRGAAKFSVPAGHYWATALFLIRGGRAARLVVLPQFTVGQSTTVHARERAATNQITITTPRPARPLVGFFNLLRSNHGFTEATSWAFNNGNLRVSPVRHPPALGTLHAYTQAQLVSPPGPGTRYTYVLDFPAPPGIIPALHYTARRNGLATVHERYYQDVTPHHIIYPPDIGFWFTLGGTPAEIAAGLSAGVVVGQHNPGRLIQYVSAGPSVIWRSFDYPVVPVFIFGVGQAGAFRRYPGGGQVTENWNRYPLHPTPSASLPGAGVIPTLPSASRAGNTLTLDLTPFGDNQRATIGSGYSSCIPRLCRGRYALYQNGMKILSGDAGKAAVWPPGDLFLRAPLSPRPSLIKFVLTASRAGRNFLLSAASTDVWTWRSRPQPTATVPPPWYCSVTVSQGQPVYHRHCAVQAMMMLRYHVAGLSPHGTTRPGRQQVAVTAGHLQLAPASPVTHASLQVSFDNGKTWHAARVTKISAGHFRAVFHGPPGAMVTLRTHATGAAGASVTETILDAYRVSAAAGG